jgi:hypothetical protein
MIPVEVMARYEGTGAHLLSASGVDIIVKTPDRGAYKRFRAMLSNDSKRADAPEALLRDCLVYPEPGVFEQILNGAPALGDIFAAKVVELTGLTSEAEAKKL